MTNIQLVNKLSQIEKNYNNVYMWGVFGSPINESLIVAKAKQYPYWYTTSRQAHLRTLIGKNYFGFDCVNLIKAVLWGWTGDANKNHGGAIYNSNGVPDMNADMMIRNCVTSSSNFKQIDVGEVVWIPGHIGVYVGQGKVIETTPRWRNNVQITACLNIGPIAGLNGRTWMKHGKLPYVKYTEQSHWAEVHYQELTREHGLIIHERAFERNMKRGEMMAFLTALINAKKL